MIPPLWPFNVISALSFCKSNIKMSGISVETILVGKPSLQFPIDIQIAIIRTQLDVSNTICELLYCFHNIQFWKGVNRQIIVLISNVEVLGLTVQRTVDNVII